MGAKDDITLEAWLEEATFEVGPKGRLPRGAIVDEWCVEAYLGAGLSAEVYRVTNVRLGHEGALKLLIDETRGLKERFLTESDAIRFLTLKTLPRFMDSGDWQGHPYYVMEFLQPLPDPMPRSHIPWFMNKVAKAVQTLHDAGYVHRDLKPGNILQRRNGEPVLIDLGLIKRHDACTGDQILRYGPGISIVDGKPVGVGTLDYAAPEQLLKGESSVQSDVFAMGKMLRAFYGGRPPQNLKSVIRRATREVPGERYPSANDFASAIRHRNLPLYLVMFLLAMIGGAAAFYPLYRPRIVAVAGWFVAHERPLIQTPNEEDVAFFRRILPTARQGRAEAQLCVGEAYLEGKGVRKDAGEAVKWFRLAAEAGEPAAQAQLGRCAHRGIGCAKNPIEAVKWYRLAAGQGNLPAMSNLAYCKLHGYGVPKDQEAGFKLALEAARRGYAPAQAMVGECYLMGFGVEMDAIKADTWFYRAARLGNARAKKLLEER